MNAPNNLQHKPIIAIDDYDKIDGMYAPDSDAKALSIGLSQYRDGISVKVFRKPNNKWSRQSEELPLHRNLDLTILILDTLAQKNISGFKKRIVDEDKLNDIRKYFKQNEDIFKDRIEKIKNIIQYL